jgi:hypothetical protein
MGDVEGGGFQLFSRCWRLSNFHKKRFWGEKQANLSNAAMKKGGCCQSSFTREWKSWRCRQIFRINKQGKVENVLCWAKKFDLFYYYFSRPSNMDEALVTLFLAVTLQSSSIIHYGIEILNISWLPVKRRWCNSSTEPNAFCVPKEYL